MACYIKRPHLCAHRVHNKIQLKRNTDMKRWRCTLSHGAHITGDCSSFCAMKHQQVVWLPSGQDASPLQGVTPNSQVNGTHLHTWVKRDIVDQSFLSKETKRCQGSNPDLWIQVQPVHLLVTMGAPWGEDGRGDYWCRLRLRQGYKMAGHITEMSWCNIRH